MEKWERIIKTQSKQKGESEMVPKTGLPKKAPIKEPKIVRMVCLGVKSVKCYNDHYAYRTREW